MKLLKLLTFIAVLTVCGQLKANDMTVTSPNGRLTATVNDDNGLTLAVSLDGKVLDRKSVV